MLLAAVDWCELFFARFFQYFSCIRGWLHSSTHKVTQHVVVLGLTVVSAEHNNNQFEVEPECLYAGYMKVAATATYSVDSVTSHLYAQNIILPEHVVGYNNVITIIYLGRPSSSSSTFISDTPGSITLQYDCMLYRKDAGERTGMQNAKASASCVTLPSKGNLVLVTKNPDRCRSVTLLIRGVPPLSLHRYRPSTRRRISPARQEHGLARTPPASPLPGEAFYQPFTSTGCQRVSSHVHGTMCKTKSVCTRYV